MRITRTAAVLGALLAAGATAHAESTLQTVLKRGQFLAGIVADSPPSAYLDAQGHQIGYCADVARYLAQRLGVKVAPPDVNRSEAVFTCDAAANTVFYALAAVKGVGRQAMDRRQLTVVIGK